MKKIILLFASLMLILTACNDEKGMYQPEATSPQIKKLSGVRFSGVKRSNEPTIELRGAARQSNLWHTGSKIKVKFMQNSPAIYQEKVRNYAKEWEEYANINFEFVTDEKAEIRIGFNWNSNHYVTWSYAGTDCKMIRSQNEPTMSFAYWDELDEVEIRAEVLRNFGLVLGLELEHRNPNFGVNWNYEKVKNYWMSEFEGEDWEEIRELVFDPFETADVYATEYDPLSIMIWGFPQKGMVQAGSPNVERYPNYDLSPLDIQFISELYPKKINANELLVKMKTSARYIDLSIKNNSQIDIDWGDGQKTLTLGTDPDIWENNTTHTYTDEIEHTITLRGSRDALIFLFCQHNYLTAIDIFENTQLKELYCANNSLTTVDLSNCPQLPFFDCTYNSVSSINLSNSTELKELRCYNNDLTSLDLSHCTQLNTLRCDFNSITSLNLSNCEQINKINCQFNSLTSLNLSDCNQLTYLACHNNQLISLDLSSNVNLMYISLEQNPFEENPSMLNAVAQSIVNRNGKEAGNFSTLNMDASNIDASSLKQILESKNWILD